MLIEVPVSHLLCKCFILNVDASVRAVLSSQCQSVFLEAVLSLMCVFCHPCRLLFLKIKAHNEKEDFAFCSVKGCERVKIKAVIPPGSGPSDCMDEAYPKYSEMPVVDVPMPKKLPRSRLVSYVKDLFKPL